MIAKGKSPFILFNILISILQSIIPIHNAKKQIICTEHVIQNQFSHQRQQRSFLQYPYYCSIHNIQMMNVKGKIKIK